MRKLVLMLTMLTLVVTTLEGRENPAKHEPVTFEATTATFSEFLEKGKKKKPAQVVKCVAATDGVNPELYFRLISEADKTLAVTKRRFASKEEEKACRKEVSRFCKKEIEVKVVIPEYVKVGDEVYTVTEIDDYVFSRYYNDDYCIKGWISEIQFPETLFRIGKYSFAYCSNLNEIILPECLKQIGEYAFNNAGSDDFTELYIPEGVKKIEVSAFKQIGPYWFWNGYYKGYLSCKPNWLTTGNCTRYGIDEEAIENYEKQAGR